MGRISSSFDNALAEAIFATLRPDFDVDHRLPRQAPRATTSDAGSAFATTGGATPRSATAASHRLLHQIAP